LNKLLYENRNGLKFIFETRKDGDMISRKEISELIEDATDEQVSNEDLNKHFLHSLENIIDESGRHARKYWYLEFHEYQEFLCRVALQLFPNEKLI